MSETQPAQLALSDNAARQLANATKTTAILDTVLQNVNEARATLAKAKDRTNG